MKHSHRSATAGLFLALAFACGAQTGANPEGDARISSVRSGGGSGGGAVPAAMPEKRAKGPTEITAREATFDNRAHLATFTGEVVVKDPEFNVTSERLTVYLRKPPELSAGAARPKPARDAGPRPEEKSGGGIEKAVAEGNVVIIQDKIDGDGKAQRYIGKGRKAVFDSATGNVTLYGWPQIGQSIGGTMSKQIISRDEDCVIVMNRVGKIDVKGYHTTTLQDSGVVEQRPR